MDVAKLINRRKNAFFGHGEMQLFLARDPMGKVVGRIAAIENGMHLTKYNDGVGFFGFYESIDDSDVSRNLFDAASDWLHGRGLSRSEERRVQFVQRFVAYFNLQLF